ncbi:hypothetical protein EJ06DRAFT_578274 [Trichodelitschia bisporula]|uniref:F-box domain-containing protein n=1 Tax=Trichodelitschia bisporula TaxID=703511 RepID=A0A6G1IAA5_9PEZI|nr:hypothetical protein EJ06DRAFT_578274 [Trichodelitschia bisporula]
MKEEDLMEEEDSLEEADSTEEEDFMEQAPSPADYPTPPVHAPAATKYPPASLLDIPGEIRNMIYANILVPVSTADHLRTIQQDEDLNVNTYLLLVCRKLYHECRGLALRIRLVAPEWLPEEGQLSVLPLAQARLGRTPRDILPLFRIDTLVVRDYLQISRSLATENREHWAKLPLHLDTVYLQMCLCHSPDSNLIFWADHTAVLRWLVQEIAGSVLSLKRIIILYCSVGSTEFYSVLDRPLNAVVETELRRIEVQG